MLGGKELEQLEAQKEALVAESELNRLTLQAEVHALYFAGARIKDVVGWRGKMAPLLLVLAPLAGLLLGRRAQNPSSWLNRAMTAAKWIGPLYSFWKGLAAVRRPTDTGEPPA